jgi:hypothetical protein
VLDTDLSGCASLALRRFWGGRRVGRPCRGASNQVDPFPRPPRLLRSVTPARGVRGTRGRVVAAVLDSVVDARVAALQSLYAGFRRLAGGGLRGGSFSASADGSRLRLRGYSYVPGVRVSGVLRTGGDGLAGLVRVRAGRLSGRLQVSEVSASGTLAGRRVRWRANVGVFARIASGQDSRTRCRNRRLATWLESPRKECAK